MSILISDEDFEKKWVTGYHPPGGTRERDESTTTSKRTDSILKGTSDSRRSIVRQTSASRSADAKLIEKKPRRSSDGSGKRTSFYVPPTPAATATEQDKIQSLSPDPSQRLNPGFNTLLQPSEMERLQCTRFSKY